MPLENSHNHSQVHGNSSYYAGDHNKNQRITLQQR